MDFTALTAAVDGATVVAAIGAIAVVLVAPIVAKWGYRKVMSMIR